MGKKKPDKPKANGRKPADKPPGCYVLSLKVKNIRCFGNKEQELDCSDGNGKWRPWTVILGENGSGKTTLLQSVVLHDDTLNFEWNTGEVSNPTHLPTTLVFSDLAAGLSRSSRAVGESTLGWTERDRDNSASVPKSGSSFWRLGSPVTVTTARRNATRSLVTAGYGANRSNSVPLSSIKSAGDAIRTLMFTQTGLRDCQEWLVQLDYSAKVSDSLNSDKSHQHELIEQVRTLLVGVLPGVEEMDFEGGSGVFPQPFVKFKTDFGWVPLRQLGHGYQTMIAWVVDFVSRMVERYPDSPNPLAEPAVCLVDEIDLHLHPVWQRKVIGYLSKRFPNTQFIVTAHSPLVVQAAASADANIAVLVRSTEKDADGNHYVEIKNNPEDVRNWRLDQILTSDLFGMPSARSVEVEQMFRRKHELLSKMKLSKAEQEELNGIEAKIRELPFGETREDRTAIDEVRNSLDMLKKKLAQ